MSTEERENQSANVPDSPAAKEDALNEAHARAWELAKRRGVLPLRDVNELRGDFWPEDESIDDFLAWLRTTRREDRDRSIPE
jgi:hypothetical protein